MWTCLRIAQARQLYPNEQCSKPRVVDDHRGLHTNQYVGDCHIPLENPYQPTSIKRGHRVLNTAQIGLSENRNPGIPSFAYLSSEIAQFIKQTKPRLTWPLGSLCSLATGSSHTRLHCHHREWQAVRQSLHCFGLGMAQNGSAKWIVWNV